MFLVLFLSAIAALESINDLTVDQLWEVAKPSLDQLGIRMDFGNFSKYVEPSRPRLVETYRQLQEQAMFRKSDPVDQDMLSNSSHKITAFPSVPVSVPVYERVGSPGCSGGSGPRKIPLPPRPPPPAGINTYSQMSQQELMMKSAQSGNPDAATKQTASMTSMTVVMVLASIFATVIPESLPPPIWNLSPLPCVPMLTGKNCYDAVNYPITFADGLMASETDAAMFEVIQDFPALFSLRTNNFPYPYAIYARCFQAMMSMKCAAAFPTCTAPQSRQWFMPGVGRMPICYTLCFDVLVFCPGFTFDDIRSSCAFPSIEPICAKATYRRLDAVPPPLEDEDDGEANGCPDASASEDPGQDPTLYEPLRPSRVFQERPGVIAGTVPYSEPGNSTELAV